MPEETMTPYEEDIERMRQNKSITITMEQSPENYLQLTKIIDEYAKAGVLRQGPDTLVITADFTAVANNGSARIRVGKTFKLKPKKEADWGDWINLPAGSVNRYVQSTTLQAIVWASEGALAVWTGGHIDIRLNRPPFQNKEEAARFDTYLKEINARNQRLGWMAVCPECKREFIRERSDMEYDTETCADTARKRKNRKRKKEEAVPV